MLRTADEADWSIVARALGRARVLRQEERTDLSGRIDRNLRAMLNGKKTPSG